MLYRNPGMIPSAAVHAVTTIQHFGVWDTAPELIMAIRLRSFGEALIGSEAAAPEQWDTIPESLGFEFFDSEIRAKNILKKDSKLNFVDDSKKNKLPCAGPIASPLPQAAGSLWAVTLLKWEPERGVEGVVGRVPSLCGLPIAGMQYLVLGERELQANLWFRIFVSSFRIRLRNRMDLELGMFEYRIEIG